MPFLLWYVFKQSTSFSPRYRVLFLFHPWSPTFCCLLLGLGSHLIPEPTFLLTLSLLPSGLPGLRGCLILQPSGLPVGRGFRWGNSRSSGGALGGLGGLGGFKLERLSNFPWVPMGALSMVLLRELYSFDTSSLRGTRKTTGARHIQQVCVIKPWIHCPIYAP
jgi:hypothetical protein